MIRVISLATSLFVTFSTALDSNKDKALSELIEKGIEMHPLEYVSLTFEGVKMAEFDYPSEEDNFWIASKSLGSS